MQGWGFVNLHVPSLLCHSYLVCILFGMPSLHLFTFLMLFKSCNKHMYTISKQLAYFCLDGAACLLISPWTASDVVPDLLTALTNSGRIGVRVTTHAYVPLSIEELRGENTTVLMKVLVIGLCSGGKVTRPGTPENTDPPLVHLLVTITSLSVIPPLRTIVQLRVKFLPA